MVLFIFKNTHPEVVHIGIGNGNTTLNIFQIQYCILKLFQLLATVLQIGHLIVAIHLDKVFFTGS
ncbi:hypothetical protein SDC9_176960 [bioreactor metagenome]|uniref:Uncharacterized protein n=1 Tax=bioreactor metagenome TaxID=1076179 RepID=A0A645GRG7_9ZZZZ